jgi:hypothetical protein
VSLDFNTVPLFPELNTNSVCSVGFQALSSACVRDLRLLFGHGILNFTGFTVVRAVRPFPFSSQPLIPPAVFYLGVFSMTKSS